MLRKTLKSTPAMTHDLRDEGMLDANNGKFFVCEARSENVSVMYCIDSFVDVNALNIKDSPCFRCEQGQCVREEFAGA